MALKLLPLCLALAVVIATGADAGTPAPRCFGREATIVADGSERHIFGTPGPDVMVSTLRDRPAHLTIHGRGGNDLICTNFNNQLVFGGPGDDSIDTGDSTYDVLVGGAGDDQLRGGAGRDYFYPQAGRDAVYGGGAIGDTVIYRPANHPIDLNLTKGYARGNGEDRLDRIEDAQGSEFDDRLVGSGSRNWIYGFGGDDVIFGRAGESTEILGGGRGDDRIVGGRGGDEIAGGEGDDRLSLGPPGASSLGRFQFAYGKEGADRMIGSNGPDYFDGDAGRDIATGRGGDDRCALVEVRDSCRVVPQA